MEKKIKLGVNSVLFGGFDFATAAKYIAMSGYDGVEIAALEGKSKHLDLDRWKEQASDLKKIVSDNNLEFLATEVGDIDEDRLTKAFEAAAEIGIPVVTIGPGPGESDSEDDLKRNLEKIAAMAEKAESFGVTLCMKAHVNAPIYSTPTTLRAMEAITSPAFGINMDPSHIHRANENPEEALPQVLSRVKHIHIRDCKGRQSGPGEPADQACGRGDINLMAYCKVLVDADYSGAMCLEIIGAQEYDDLARVSTIAAESYGYLNACLKALGAR